MYWSKTTKALPWRWLTQSGTVLEHYRYDLFGEQRTISTSYYHAIASKGYLPTTQRGYTGHEMLNNVNVIHMNGRIYDPTIGRFLQADGGVMMIKRGDVPLNMLKR